MRDQKKANDVAELIIYCDAIQNILLEYNFKYNSKVEFGKIEQSTRKILKAAFANTEVTDLDNFVFDLRKFTQEIIKGKIYENTK